MQERNSQPPGSSRRGFPVGDGESPEHGTIARIIQALPFASIVFFLALWITAFLLLKDELLAPAYAGSQLTNLICLTFFGGLVSAIFAGAMLGNLLRRILWKTLVRRGK